MKKNPKDNIGLFLLILAAIVLGSSLDASITLEDGLLRIAIGFGLVLAGIFVKNKAMQKV